MGYPATDFIGFTIKTKKRAFKHRGKRIIFDTRVDAEPLLLSPGGEVPFGDR